MLLERFQKINAEAYGYGLGVPAQLVQVKKDLYLSCFNAFSMFRIDGFLDPNKNNCIKEVVHIEGKKVRSNHTAMNYNDELVILIGGVSDGIFGESIRKSVYKYNVKTEEFGKLPELNQARYNAASCQLDYTVYVAAGNSARYSPL